MGFHRERIKPSQNFPFPRDGETVLENPPCLVWIPSEPGTKYTVTVRDGQGRTVFWTETDRHYAYDQKHWEPGRYTWNIVSDDGSERGEQSFLLSERAISVERPTALEVFDGIPADLRPRHLFAGQDIPTLMDDHRGDFEILKVNVRMALDHGLPEPPRYHRDAHALPYREYFGAYRDFCDRDLIACALMYALTGDEPAGAHAKELLLHICDMNPSGPCSLMSEWGDEVGLSNARCLPAALDLLWDLLDGKQRGFVAATVAAYARQCATRIARINYTENPSNSHVGRLPAYLGEAALVLKGTGAETDETLIGWLDTALDIYNGIFPFYGCRDGSWAEGAFYSTSYTKWYLPFFSAVERFSGKSLFTRPFYQRYTQYLLHFCNADYENHPFGDGYWCRPTDAEWPGFFAQNPYRVYAERFGPALALRRMNQTADTDYFRLHLLDIFLPKPSRAADHTLTGEVKQCELFAEGGFAAIHTDIDSCEDICLLLRASPYTADSHRHADQGSFALYCGGKALISPSGYFGRRYGSRHHVEWTRNTVAHNVALIDGRGQIKTVDAIGRFVSFDEETKTAVLDLTAAYEGVTSYRRTLQLNSRGMTLRDEIVCDGETTVTLPLHALVPPERIEEDVLIRRENCQMTVRVTSGELALREITDRYSVDLNADEPPQYHVRMPRQYHLYYESRRARRHAFELTFEIENQQ